MVRLGGGGPVHGLGALMSGQLGHSRWRRRRLALGTPSGWRSPVSTYFGGQAGEISHARKARSRMPERRDLAGLGGLGARQYPRLGRSRFGNDGGPGLPNWLTWARLSTTN